MGYIIIFYFWYFLYLLYRFIYIAHKFQTTQIVHEGHDDSIAKKFFHPIMQSFAFFIMESICLLIFYLTPPIKKTSYSSKIFIIPAAADLFSSILQCSALAMISGSTFMMLKGANIVTTLVFARWLINFDIKSRHIVGCGLAVIGLVIVGLADIYLSDKTATSTSDVFYPLLQNLNTVGYVLMVVSLVFNGFLYAYEQKLLKEYEISPLEMVGWEGVYGTIMSLLLVIILCFIPCPYSGNKCVYDSQSQPFIELPSVYLSQIFSSLLLLFLVVAGLVSNAFYNFYGVTITQTMDGLTRSLLNVCRTALIWIIGIMISLNVSNDSPYRIESLKWSVNSVKFIGFFCIISGTLIYNRVFFDQLMG